VKNSRLWNDSNSKAMSPAGGLLVRWTVHGAQCTNTCSLLDSLKPLLKNSSIYGARTLSGYARHPGMSMKGSVQRIRTRIPCYESTWHAYMLAKHLGRWNSE
jgi:hypothetical protein